MDLYEILEVSPNASSEVIKNAYKALAKKYHPDMHSGIDVKHAEEQMKKINYAYEVLSDDFKRAQYDREIRHNEYKQSSSKSTYEEKTYNNGNDSNNQYSNEKTQTNQSQNKNTSCNTDDVSNASVRDKIAHSKNKYLFVLALLFAILLIIFSLGSNFNDKPKDTNSNIVSYDTKVNENAIEKTLENSQESKDNIIPTKLTRTPTIKKTPTIKTTPTAKINSTANANVNKNTSQNSKPNVKKAEDNKIKATNISYFTIGSSREDVKKVMGTPTSVRNTYNGESWSYNFSNIEFDSNGKVIEWFENGTKLKVSLGNKDPNAPSFTKGSTKGDVVKAMGTPTSVRNTYNGESWSYNFSNIEFDSNGKVIEWFENGTKLKVSLGNKDPNAPSFTKGSTKGDVVKAMGTPTSVRNTYNGESWSYNFSNIEFDGNGKVIEWFENGTKLKVK